MGKDTDLLNAVKTGDVSYVRKALQKYRSNHKHKKSSKKVTINVPDNDGFTILHHAALNGNVEVIMALIEMQADPNARDQKGMCPIHMAAWAGRDQGVKCLLQSNALVDLPSFNGETAIHLGSQHGYASVVDFLLQFKADPSIRNSALETPLDLACQYGHTAVVRKLLKSEKVITMLRGRHDDPRFKSPLHLASKSGHADIVRLLIESGADVNEETLHGTCLHHASLYGKTEVVRLLLEAGADVNTLNKNGMTPLDIVNKFTTSRAGIQIKQLLREAAGERIVYARALSDYHNIYDNSCLSFKAGDTITVLEQNEDGRWKGSIFTDTEEKVGYFPAQVVTLASERRPTSSRYSAGSLDSGLSNSSDKENRVPKQSPQKGGSTAAKAVGVVPIGSYEVLTLATGGSSSQKQKQANIPRMSSFKRAAAPVVQQRTRANGEFSDFDQRRYTDASSLEKPDLREHRAMTYDVVPTRSKAHQNDMLPQGLNATQLALAAQQAFEDRQEREEGYAVTSPDASLRNYAEVVVESGRPGYSPTSISQTPIDYTQVYVGSNNNNNNSISSKSGHLSSHNDSNSAPRHSFHSQSSNDSRKEEEKTEQKGVPSPLPIKRTSDEKNELKTARKKEGYVDMSLKKKETANKKVDDVPELPKKQTEVGPGLQREELQHHGSLYKIESRGQRGRQESYENFSPRIKPLPVQSPFTGTFTNGSSRTETLQADNFQTEMPPYENYRPGVVPPIPLKPSRHSYENIMPGTDYCVKEEEKPVPLPPKLQRRRSEEDSKNQVPQSPVSTDSTMGISPMIDYSSLSQEDKMVFDWLSEQKLPCYFESFQKEGFDMTGVCGLTPEDLTILGITKAGHRKKLLSEVTKLEPPRGLPLYKPEDVRTWLSLMCMEHYEENFIEGGFDDIDFIKDLDRNDLEMIEIRKRGHQRKLLLAVKKLAQLELTASLDKIVEGPLESSSGSSHAKDADEHVFEFPPPPSFPILPPPPIDEFDDLSTLSHRENLPPPPGAESETFCQTTDRLSSPRNSLSTTSTASKSPVLFSPRLTTSQGIFAIRNGEKEPAYSTSSSNAPNSPSFLHQTKTLSPVKPPRSPSMPTRSGTLPAPKPKPKPVGIKGQVQTAAEYHGAVRANTSKGMVFVGPSINDESPEVDVTPSKSREFWKQASSGNKQGTNDYEQQAQSPPRRTVSMSGVKPIPPAKPPVVLPKPKRRNTESEMKIKERSVLQEPQQMSANGSCVTDPTFNSYTPGVPQGTEGTKAMKRVPPPAPPRKDSMPHESHDKHDEVFVGSAEIDRCRTLSGPLDEKIKATFKKSSSSSFEEKKLSSSQPSFKEQFTLGNETAEDDQIQETDVLIADIDNLIADFSTQLESLF